MSNSLPEAAVLIPCWKRDGHLWLWLTERTSHVKHHPGQISFPGGKRDVEDGHLTETALREFEEEVGIARQHVKILSSLPTQNTSTGFLVSPFVGFITESCIPKINPHEVAMLIELPLAFLQRPDTFEKNPALSEKLTPHIYCFHYGSHFIWGVTASILKSFLGALEETPYPFREMT